MTAVQFHLVALIEAGWPRPVYLRLIDPEARTAALEAAKEWRS
jgi:hypothetical protein